MVRAAALEEKSLFEARSVIKKLDDKKYDVTAEEPDIITGARIKPEKLKIGECVFVKKMNTSGIVSGFGKNGKIEIKINKMTVLPTPTICMNASICRTNRNRRFRRE